MKIVFNSFFDDSPATIFYRAGLKLLANIAINDFQNYENYSYALFMGFVKDLDELRRAKEKNPNLLCGVVDPRGDRVEKYISYIDFFVVDSIEMLDFFSKFQRPIFKYYEYMPVALQEKEHADKDKIIIGYHGNKVHLMAMYSKVVSVLDELSEKYPLEFWALYNIENLGRWEIGIPKKIKVRHIQFNEENYEDVIRQMDIGIVPAMLPFYKKKSVIRSILPFRLILNHRHSDYIFRFKMLTNAGRMIVFALLGVPVVSDMFPSACEFIRHGENGYLAYSSAGWYTSLEKLIKSASLRNVFSRNLQKDINERVNYLRQNEDFMAFLSDLKPGQAAKPFLLESPSYSVFALYIVVLKKFFATILKKSNQNTNA